MHICVYITYIYTYICTHTFTCMHIYILYIYICAYVFIYVCLFKCIFEHIYMCVYMFVCMHLWRKRKVNVSVKLTIKYNKYRYLKNPFWVQQQSVCSAFHPQEFLVKLFFHCHSESPELVKLAHFPSCASACTYTVKSACLSLKGHRWRQTVPCVSVRAFVFADSGV